jgi:hypothetical protein
MTNKVKVKKPFYKRWWFIVIAVIVVIGVFTNLGGDKEDKTDSADLSQDPVIEEDLVVEEEPVVEEETKVDIESLEKDSLAMIKESFGEVGDIGFIKEEKAFTITPTDPNFIVGVMSALEGDKESLDAWNGMVEGFVSLSDSLSKSLSGYSISIVNPDNTDNFILMIKDGIVVYDAVND